jgi:hypothetical protein
MRAPVGQRAWRAFRPYERRVIEQQLAASEEAACPRCDQLLEARPGTRLAAVLPPGVIGIDLDCRRCRRFFARVRHSPASVRSLRLRRFAAAVLRA